MHIYIKYNIIYFFTSLSKCKKKSAVLIDILFIESIPCQILLLFSKLYYFPCLTSILCYIICKKYINTARTIVFPGVLFSQFTLDTIPVLTTVIFFLHVFFFLRGRMISTKINTKTV